jgi:hypothetical protein
VCQKFILAVLMGCCSSKNVVDDDDSIISEQQPLLQPMAQIQEANNRLIDKTIDIPVVLKEYNLNIQYQIEFKKSMVRPFQLEKSDLLLLQGL